MKLKSLGPCDICKENVSELGSYVKMALNRYAHGQCFYDVAYDKGKIDGRQAVLAEQEAERARERQSQEERQARERAMEERRLEVAERERTNRILAQREMPLPPKHNLCVQCRKQITLQSTEHPNTCDSCWNSDAPTKAVGDALKPLDTLDATLKRFSLIEMDEDENLDEPPSGGPPGDEGP